MSTRSGHRTLHTGSRKQAIAANPACFGAVAYGASQGTFADEILRGKRVWPTLSKLAPVCVVVFRRLHDSKAVGMMNRSL